MNAIDVCSNFLNKETGQTINECDQDEATSSSGSCLSQPGDSGGPVFTASSTTDPFAVGTDTGSGPSCTTAYWSDMFEEKVIFGQSPATG